MQGLRLGCGVANDPDYVSCMERKGFVRKPRSQSGPSAAAAHGNASSSCHSRQAWIVCVHDVPCEQSGRADGVEIRDHIM
jgi:hypothetical protein